ncbi:hypothetical protein QTO34_014936 [Cnephaeus nilssonii]|uniref:Fibronectin type-III domain-containing protein n=1 Tax=Cnephaeus nilssonii TaxID=3371016 RepID=A0AA40LUT4_CNENI|nr:hypothetical protein QTO34_014936 [Eptesicus nilssonii]
MARGLRGWLGGCLLVTATGVSCRQFHQRLPGHLRAASLAVAPRQQASCLRFCSYRKFQDICVGTAATECDFSELSKYGDHTLRVRAERGDEHSDWVNITFCPVDDTVIGPPGVRVEALANSLHVRFLAPRIEKEHETWTMKNIYSSWVYNVEYWKNGSDTKHPVACQYDFEVLRNLAPWTTYCVRVRGFLPDRNKTGRWSEPVCEGTVSDDSAPSWIVVASVLAASVLAACLLLAGCFALLWSIYKGTKYTFSPGNALPQHLKEFLSRPQHNRLLFLSFPPSDESDVFDKLSVVTEVSESSPQPPGDSSVLGTPSGQGLPPS